MHTIEWQKRGLPHAHILLWLKEPIRANDIDKIISAEIPSLKDDPELFAVVTSCMIHGPCGKQNKNSPCMRDGKCSKKFPKEFTEHTKTDGEGYPDYKRRSPDNGGRQVKIVRAGKEYIVDNSWVVPFNSELSKFFDAHINVEVCHTVKLIKYVLKYVNKGSDMAVYGLVEEKQPKNPNDEIEKWQLARHISSSEAAWRMFKYDIHQHEPAVLPLGVHLPDEHIIYFDEDLPVQPTDKDTTLIAFFKLCDVNELAKTLLYVEVPNHFIWKGSKWQPRKTAEKAIGRVYAVSPKLEECFCLRLLLFEVKGPTSYEFLRTYEGELHPTFKEACRARGLLEDDMQYFKALEEAYYYSSSSPRQLRDLFCTIISSCDVASCSNLWETLRNSYQKIFIIKSVNLSPQQILLMLLKRVKI